MRVLVLCAVYHPDQIGGAEVSARNLVRFLVQQGHEVAVLTTARRPEEAQWGELVDGVKMYRAWMPRPYPLMDYTTARRWQKPLWHLLDYVDPRNRWLLRRVLREFRPEFVNVHVLQGLGFNLLAELARSGLPVMQVLPDLSLACVKTTMFKAGHTCAAPCRPVCAATAWLKNLWLERLARVGFCSPSAANLATLRQHLPAVRARPGVVRLNANPYPQPSVPGMPREAGAPLRLLYVGRLDGPKGVGFLLGVVESVARHVPVHLTVVGKGPDEAALRERYAGAAWCEFKGHVPQAEVANAMAGADALAIPSLWAENSPGVVIHALSLGLPVLGSAVGGIPELVQDGVNGRLLPSGDAGAWQQALEELAVQPEILASWRTAALAEAGRFAPEALGQAIVAWMEEIRAMPVQALRVQIEESAAA